MSANCTAVRVFGTYFSNNMLKVRTPVTSLLWVFSCTESYSFWGTRFLTNTCPYSTSWCGKGNNKPFLFFTIWVVCKLSKFGVDHWVHHSDRSEIRLSSLLPSGGTGNISRASRDLLVKTCVKTTFFLRMAMVFTCFSLANLGVSIDSMLFQRWQVWSLAFGASMVLCRRPGLSIETTGVTWGSLILGDPHINKGGFTCISSVSLSLWLSVSLSECSLSGLWPKDWTTRSSAVSFSKTFLNRSFK